MTNIEDYSKILSSEEIEEIRNLSRWYNKVGFRFDFIPEKKRDYEKAIACYGNVAEKFPDDELAWNALFKIGRCYEDMEKAGLISAEKADAKIKAAYQKLIEKYPDCSAVKIAKRWLSSHN